MTHDKLKKIGIVAMPDLSKGGGFPRVAQDLIAALKALGKEVHLLTPYKLDYKKISELHGSIKPDKVYRPTKSRKFFIRDTYFSRRFIKKEFQNLTKRVDLIIDMDGGILHNYLPRNFDHSKYIIWRISGTDSDIGKINLLNTNKKHELKMFLKKHVLKQPIPSRKHKIYPLDEWTGNEIKKIWSLNHEDLFLYPEIKVDELLKYKGKKKNQAMIFGRLAPLKKIEDSVKIFAEGTKNHKNYNLVILGGTTSETQDYLKKINNLIKNLEISDKVKIIKDPSFEELKKVLVESKVLIDSQQGVSLTMTAIEAIAAGNIVLAYKNGGTFTEVLERGTYGYGFFKIEEGIEEFRKILENLKKGKLNKNTFRKRADFFSKQAFRARIKKILEQANS